MAKPTFINIAWFGSAGGQYRTDCPMNRDGVCLIGQIPCNFGTSGRLPRRCPAKAGRGITIQVSHACPDDFVRMQLSSRVAD